MIGDARALGDEEAGPWKRFARDNPCTHYENIFQTSTGLLQLQRRRQSRRYRPLSVHSLAFFALMPAAPALLLALLFALLVAQLRLELVVQMLRLRPALVLAVPMLAPRLWLWHPVELVVLMLRLALALALAVG